MRRTNRRIIAAALALLIPFAAVVVSADEPARAEPDAAKLDEVLARWGRQAATRKTLEVRFTREDRSPAWGVERFEGALVIKDEDNAAIHYTKPGEKGRAAEPIERLIWAPAEIRQFDYQGRRIFVFARPKDVPPRLPYLLRLPFLYGQTLADWKDRHDFRLVREDDTSYLIRITPRPGPPAKSDWKVFLALLSGKYFPTELGLYQRALLRLDKETMLPKSFLIVAPNGKDTQDYRVSAIRCNEPIRRDLFQVLDVEGWSVRSLKGG